MPNERIIERIDILLRQFRTKEITLRSLADQFSGHISALEGLSYPQIKQAEMAGTRLQLLADLDPSGEAVVARVTPVLMELQYWLLGIPGYSAKEGNHP